MTDATKLRLDLPLVLPGVDDVRDRCVARLIDLLAGRPGISEAHIVGPDGPAPELCIHYDPATLSLSRVRELARAAGAELSAAFGHLLITTSAAMQPRAASRIAESLRKELGVLEADVAASGAVRIEYDRGKTSEKALRNAAAKLGLSDEKSAPNAAKPAPGKDENAGHDHGKAAASGGSPEVAAPAPAPAKGGHADHHHASGGPFGEKSEIIFAILAGGLLATGWLLDWREVGPGWLPRAFYVAAYGFGGWFTAKEAFENLRERRFAIDTLTLVAAIGAAALGKWAEGALLLFLFGIGHSLEQYAMGRARRAIEALAELAPDTATVRRGGSTQSIAVAELRLGDVVIVRPNERLPADGVVVVGTSSVNQAPVTGESVPVDKRPTDDAKAALAAFDKLGPEFRVFAGTINGAGAIEVMVARRAEQSTMARVVKMVTEAQAQRSPTQQFTERFERIFVPSVLVLVAVLLFAGFVVDEPFAATFYRAMAVLVAASPCALAISVPSAVLSGVARAARGGVLIKGGGALENLGSLTSIAFDKTGTLTEGKPKLTDAVPAPGATEDELLAVALAVEEKSDHPLASAVVAGARERLADRIKPATVADVKSITGRGVSAQVDGQTVHIGKPVLFSELPDSALPAAVDEANRQLVANGRTTMVVRQGARFLGVLGVMDTPRPVAGQVMAELRQLGIERLIMISGDNQQVADAVAKTVGLTEARGDLMPEQKVEAIKKLRQEHGKVAMVGDGVNDAPAMANATVGIAMGAAGSDVALETADVALMADDLAQLPFAVGLSRSSSRIIKQNLWVSLGVVVVLIPATIFGLGIATAVLFHEGSTLIVVANALRLLAYKGKTPARAVPAVGEAKIAEAPR
jgi:Zn2+/Cd2+-exporting ATPase